MVRFAVAADLGLEEPPRKDRTAFLMSNMALMVQNLIHTRRREDEVEVERVRRTYLPRRTWRIKKIRARRRRG